MKSFRHSSVFLLSCFLLFIALPASGQVKSDNIEFFTTLDVTDADTVYELALFHEWLFVAAGTDGLKVVDLAAPRSPALAGEMGDIGEVVYIAIRSFSEIYVLCRDIPRPDGFVYDQGVLLVRWNTGLRQLEQWGFVPLSNDFRAMTLDLDIWANRLNVFSRKTDKPNSLLTTLDISAVNQVPTIQYSYSQLRYQLFDAVRTGDLILGAGSDQGFVIQSLPVPGAKEDKTVNTRGFASRVELWNLLTFLVAENSGFWVIRPTIENPEVIANTATHGRGNAQDLFLHPPWAFIADGFGGVQVVDFTDARSPEPLAWIEPEFGEFEAVSIVYGTAEDLVAWLTREGQVGIAQFPYRTPTPTPNPDLNHDGFVDYRDAFLFGNHWNSSIPTSTPTPTAVNTPVF
jgi:hypothetical protein